MVLPKSSSTCKMRPPNGFPKIFKDVLFQTGFCLKKQIADSESIGKFTKCTFETARTMPTIQLLKLILCHAVSYWFLTHCLKHRLLSSMGYHFRVFKHCGSFVNYLNLQIWQLAYCFWLFTMLSFIYFWETYWCELRPIILLYVHTDSRACMWTVKRGKKHVVSLTSKFPLVNIHVCVMPDYSRLISYNIAILCS